MDPHRGELWRVSLDRAIGSEVAKTRPCLVLTTDVVNQHRRTVVVVPLSSSPSAYPPIRVAVTCEGRSAVAVVDQIRAIAKQRLRSRIGLARADQIQAVEDALKQILELG